MRVKTKKLASLVTASILAFSAIYGGVGITASAEEKTDIPLWFDTTTTNYTTGYKLRHGINAINSLNMAAENDALYLGMANVGYMGASVSGDMTKKTTV